MKLRDIIFCDDVRTETHNKFLNSKIQNQKDGRCPWSYALFNFKINGKNIEPLSGEVKMKHQQNLMTLNIVMDGLPVEKGALGFDLKLLSNKKEVFSVSQDEALKVMSEITPKPQ